MGWAFSHSGRGDIPSLLLSPWLAQTLRKGLVEVGRPLPTHHPRAHDVLCDSIYLHSPELRFPSRALPASGSTQAGGQRLCPQGRPYPDQFRWELGLKGELGQSGFGM